MRRGPLVAVVALCLIAPVSAQLDDEQSILIEPDEQYEYGFEIDGALGTVPIEIHVELVSGPPINVVLLDQDGYDAFMEGGSFTAVKGHEYEGRTEVEIQTELTDNGDYYVVVDNFDMAGQEMAAEASTVTFTVVSNESASIPGATVPLVLLGLVAAAYAARHGQ